MKTKAIILGAGKGTRMKSNIPKVLHEIMEVPLVEYVIKSVAPMTDGDNVLVIGHGGDQVKDRLEGKISFAWQKEQKGTGHAVICASELIKDTDNVFVLCGDAPLMREETLKELKDFHLKENLSGTVLTAKVKNPTGYGRIITKNGFFSKIIEEKDATLEEKTIDEVNSGTYIFKTKDLLEALKELKTDNAQGEYYLTDVLSIFLKKGLLVKSFALEDENEILGINNRVQLSEASKIMQRRINERLMYEGVTFVDPDSAYIGIDVKIGIDTTIAPNVAIVGKSIIAENVYIGRNTKIVDSEIGEGTSIEQSTIVQSKIDSNGIIGPYAYLRPGTHLKDGVKVGDYCEVKNSIVDNGTKIPHHSYIGDSDIGKKVNIGAGTITCNYDGKNKNRTIIKDGAFIGSNSNLIAPITIGERAYVAAGTTVTKSLKSKSLGISRVKLEEKSDWNKGE